MHRLLTFMKNIQHINIVPFLGILKLNPNDFPQILSETKQGIQDSQLDQCFGCRKFIAKKQSLKKMFRMHSVGTLMPNGTLPFKHDRIYSMWQQCEGWNSLSDIIHRCPNKLNLPIKFSLVNDVVQVIYSDCIIQLNYAWLVDNIIAIKQNLITDLFKLYPYTL